MLGDLMIRDYDKDIRTLFLAIVRSQMAILKVRKIPPYFIYKKSVKNAVRVIHFKIENSLSFLSLKSSERYFCCTQRWSQCIMIISKCDGERKENRLVHDFTLVLSLFVLAKAYSFSRLLLDKAFFLMLKTGWGSWNATMNSNFLEAASEGNQNARIASKNFKTGSLVLFHSSSRCFLIELISAFFLVNQNISIDVIYICVCVTNSSYFSFSR